MSTYDRVSEVIVSAVPEDDMHHMRFSVAVAWRGGVAYAVVRHRQCLGTDGQWDYETVPSERTDEWIAAHRFTYTDAILLARKACQDITVNGLTVAEVLAHRTRSPGVQ
jgi:predicted phage gp36 major capsid-like protein